MAGESAATDLDYQNDAFDRRLEAVSKRAERQRLLGLGTDFPADQFKEIISGADSSRQTDLIRILTPHIDSSEQRLDEVEPLYELVSSFLNAVNDLLVGKELTWRATGRGGFRVISKNGRRVSLDNLSSGEKQLLLLLFNTLLARDSASLILIDEPEISLNAVWQRKICQVLLGLTENTEIQFIIATHSFDILSQYPDQIASFSERD